MSYSFCGVVIILASMELLFFFCSKFKTFLLWFLYVVLNAYADKGHVFWFDFVRYYLICSALFWNPDWFSLLLQRKLLSSYSYGSDDYIKSEGMENLGSPQSCHLPFMVTSEWENTAHLRSKLQLFPRGVLVCSQCWSCGRLIWQFMNARDGLW